MFKTSRYQQSYIVYTSKNDEAVYIIPIIVATEK